MALLPSACSGQSAPGTALESFSCMTRAGDHHISSAQLQEPLSKGNLSHGSAYPCWNDPRISAKATHLTLHGGLLNKSPLRIYSETPPNDPFPSHGLSSPAPQELCRAGILPPGALQAWDTALLFYATGKQTVGLPWGPSGAAVIATGCALLHPLLSRSHWGGGKCRLCPDQGTWERHGSRRQVPQGG